MKYFIILTGLLSISTAFAQTKLIAHKRYGGNNSNFKNEWFIGSSNFGMAPEFRVKNARLDSVILLSDKVAVMVTSEVCQTKDYSDRVLDESIWRPGKDTVYNHVLFNGKNNEEEIRQILKSEYNFQNSPRKVVLIGFKKDRMFANYSTSPELEEQDSLQLTKANNSGNKNRKRNHFMRWVMFSVMAIFFRSQI